MTTDRNPWLHRFAVLLAGATLLLIVAGASVTSTGSGLAVPDWPLSFGQVFPPMVGGVLYEHGHRMIAGVVLALTVVLTVWLFRAKERPGLRRLGVAALVVIVAQALLGGLTVLLRLPSLVSVSHAGLAQIFFCIVVSIAVMTSSAWRETSSSRAADTTRFRRLALVTTGVIYVQILIGALMRHTGAGLAIPDFPLSYGRLVPPYFSQPILIHYAHRVGAVVVSLSTIWLLVEIIKNRRGAPQFVRPGSVLTTLLIAQILFGALTIWTRRAVIPTTVHVGIGAAVLAASLVITLRSRHGLERSVDSAGRAVSSSERASAPGAFVSGAMGGLSGGEAK